MSCTQQDLTITNKIHCDYGPIGKQESLAIGNFQIQEDLLRYLDHFGHLLEIEENAQKYRQLLVNSQENCEIEPPFRFVVVINFGVLTDISVLLSDALLNDPLGTRQSLHEVVLHATRTLGNLPTISHDQVEVPIRLLNLTKLRGVTDTNNGLGFLQGVLVSRTTVKKYVRSTFFRCPSEVCEHSLGCRVPGHFLDKRIECSECGLVKVEEARARVIGDHVVGVIIDQSALQYGTFKRFQGLCVSFQDDLTKDLELGVHYEIAGYWGPNTFHAWSVRRWQSSPSVRILQGLPLLLPNSVEKLRACLMRSCPNSPWVFVAAIAKQLAYHLFPVSAFLNLKIGILLSLASLGGSCPIPLLAVGTESLSAHALLLHSAQLAPRSIVTPLCLPIGGSEKGDDGTQWSEAGALLLARSGVCYLGDWAKFRLASNRAPILAAVESKMVTLDSPGLIPGPTPAASSFPLNTAVWTYWPENKQNDSQPANQVQLRTLIHVFGMPYLADAGGQEDELTRHILQSAISGCERSIPDIAIPHDELKEFIANTIARPVQLGERAIELIQDYFVASRRVRPDCLPVGAVTTITALSEAHARLSLHDEVNCADVLAVLCLYEETIAHMFGQSHLTSAPARNFYNLSQVDEQMRDFASWLENYIKSVLGDSFKSMG